MSSNDRFCRQEILPEIGPSGQARLEQASLSLPRRVSPRARAVAQSYAERAGISQVIELETADTSLSGPWLPAFRHASSREVAEGATLALEAMREALDLHSAS